MFSKHQTWAKIKRTGRSLVAKSLYQLKNYQDPAITSPKHHDQTETVYTSPNKRYWRDPM